MCILYVSSTYKSKIQSHTNVKHPKLYVVVKYVLAWPHEVNNPFLFLHSSCSLHLTSQSYAHPAVWYVRYWVTAECLWFTAGSTVTTA